MTIGELVERGLLACLLAWFYSGLADQGVGARCFRCLVHCVPAGLPASLLTCLYACMLVLVDPTAGTETRTKTKMNKFQKTGKNSNTNNTQKTQKKKNEKVKISKRDPLNEGLHSLGDSSTARARDLRLNPHYSGV